MLRHSFQHLPNVGPATEEEWWKQGITTWEGAACSPCVGKEAREGLTESERRLETRDALFFAQALPSHERWRLYSDFFHDAAFLDIETTGLGGDSYTTMVGVLDCSGYRSFIRGENLDDLPEALAGYRLIVTFNGIAFDMPFLRREFGPVAQDAAQMDLMYVLRRLGFRGGLKRIEQALGVGRPSELASLSGFDAVRLWNMSQTGEPDALPTLIRYNAEDVASLPRLAAIAVAEHAAGTPMTAVPVPPPLTFDPSQLPYDASLVYHLAGIRARSVLRGWGRS